jgi:hypothetical protein
MKHAIDEGGNPMKRRAHLLVVALVATGLALVAQAGASTAQPPTTASLMPAYVQAAKYWQSRPLEARRAARSHRHA